MRSDRGVAVLPRKGRSAADTSKRSGTLRATQVALVLLGLLVTILVLATWLDLLGGLARWGIILVVLFMGTWLVLVFVGRRSSAVRPLQWVHAPPFNPADPVEGLRVLLKRAEQGRPFSQLLLAQRVRNALLEKARVGRGVSYDRLNEIRRDPSALTEFLGDKALAKFVLEADSATAPPAEGGADEGLLSPSGKGFLERLASILSRVEAWH